MNARAILSGTIASAAVAMSTPLHAKDEAYDRAVEAVQARMAPIDAMDGRIPARALVFVKAGEAPVVDVRGVADVESGRPAEGDTPFYIASMTKAFVGLMAVELDRMGVMPLVMTLGEAYPQMRVEGVDLSQVTMRDALSHRMGFTSPALSLRTAYTDRAPVADYAAIVSASNEKTDPAFSYTNSGYLLYAGALEQRTGRSWKSWLDQLVLAPLGMHHSSARTSDLPLASHTHEIYESGWRTYQPKSDDIMHAAGGMVVSAADMAKWLQANAGAEGGIARETFAAAHRSLAQTSDKAGPVSCTGYALGWRECDAAGVRFLEHGGAYTGARSEMIVLPDHGVGFAAMFNSDSMTGTLARHLFTIFVMAYAGQEDALPPPDTFAAGYAGMADEYRVNRSKRETPRDGQAAAAVDPSRLTGTYAHPAFGDLELAQMGDRLIGTLNGTAIVISPVGPDLFRARLITSSEVQDLRFERGGPGKLDRIDWGGNVFARTD